MPLPKPRKGEKQDDFIDRCMGDEVMNKEYPDAPQRAAVCHRQWRDRKKKNEEPDAMADKLRAVPVAALHFADESATVGVEGDGDKKRKFKVWAYSGKPFVHFWWDNFAIDLKGIKHPDKMGFLDSHWSSKRVGVIKTFRIDAAKGVYAEGPALRNEHARALLDDMDDEFPFQASVYARPLKIEEVRRGATAKVNGHTLAGPATIFREAMIEEVSICVFGYDRHTRSIAAAGGEDMDLTDRLISQGGDKMATKPDLKEALDGVDFEQINEANPELAAALVARGTVEAKVTLSDEMRQKVTELADVLGDETAAKLAVADGVEPLAAAKAFIVKLQADQTAALAAKDAEIAKLGNGVPPAPKVTPDDKPSGEPQTWPEAKAVARLELGSEAKQTAVDKLAATKWPKLYEEADKPKK